MRIEKMARFVQGVRTLLTLIQAKVCVFGIGLKAVSYTHLTLPTTERV
ncbi:hypothetical protein JMUB7545_27740 [Staphylococcus aureus]